MVMLSSNKPLVEAYTISPVSCRIRQWFCAARTKRATVGLRRNVKSERKRDGQPIKTVHKSGNCIDINDNDAHNRKLRKIVGRAGFAQTLNWLQNTFRLECQWAMHSIVCILSDAILLFLQLKRLKPLLRRILWVAQDHFSLVVSKSEIHVG